MSLFQGNCVHLFGHFVHSYRTIDKVLSRNMHVPVVGVCVGGGGEGT